MVRPHDEGECGNAAMLKKLLAKGADVDGVDADGNTPLVPPRCVGAWPLCKRC